jgi:hypothetical protein
MKAVRTIFALLIALAVATVPVSAGLAVPASSGAAEMAGMDCCPQPAPCNKAVDDCAAMAVCALKCFNFFSPIVSDVVAPTTAVEVGPMLAIEAPRSQSSQPPFRPPRV